MANDIVIVQTTSDDEDQAKALARGAVESKLAAGVHIDAPITGHSSTSGAGHQMRTGTSCARS